MIGTVCAMAHFPYTIISHQKDMMEDDNSTYRANATRTHDCIGLELLAPEFRQQYYYDDFTRSRGLRPNTLKTPSTDGQK